MHRAHTNIKSETIICSQCKAKLVITMHTNSQNKCNNMLIYRFTNLNDLKEHIQTDHQISVDHNNYHFPSIEAFQQWKKDEEIRYNSTYILQCGSRMRQQRRYWYYYCNRSGRYEAKGKDKRSLKLQGTNKIGTAHMTVQQQPAGDVNVTYCSTHFNHSIELGHIGIPEPIRMKVVSKLQQGVTINRILDDIRESIHGDMTREHLITRQDILNIRRQYNIDGIERHHNDHTSLQVWVEELKSLEYNPVVLFKQGEVQKEGMNHPDFLLGLQTEFQRDMMKRFGGNVICKDATHGTNIYDFYLISLLVIDEFGEGIPVAWAVSNREDGCALTQFFKSLKKRTGDITPNVLMTDDAEQYWNAWVGIYGPNKIKKLLCKWHIDRAWRKALQEHIANNEDKIRIYHFLQVLLSDCEKSTFTVTLQQFLSITADTYPSFHHYFLKKLL